MTTSELASRPGDRIVALACYGLMIAAPFTAGALGLIAVGVAYVWRGRAEPLERSHFDFMIRRFWMDLILVGLGLICLSGALGAGFGALIGSVFGPSGAAVETWEHIGIGAIVLAVLWAGLWAVGLGSLVLGSIRGAMRLASGRPAGKTQS
jgi:uncharacterized membrane protein